MLLARDQKIMGNLTSGRLLGAIGWIATAALIRLSPVQVVSSIAG
jgi:hypothetical protein